MSLSPASDALNLSDTNTSPSVTNDAPTNTMNDLAGQIAPAGGVKRKPNRRANTAERRATHNAVERQRRETLNGRFLDLAALLPNLSQIRRPSKSSIVNSSIAHIQASRRHRLIASRELKMLSNEADALRREVNEWRDRAGLPRVEEPVRGDAFAMVISGELEIIQGIPLEEEDEDGEDGFGAALPMGAMPSHPQQQVQVYNTAFMDNVEEEAAMLGTMYAQQQNGGIHPAHLTPQHQIHLQHPMMISQPQELEDPRIAALLLKNSNSFTQPTVPSNGYPSVNTRSTTYANGPVNWIPSQIPGFAPGHLYTPPSTSHGLPGNSSASGSPVGGVSANGTNTGSPASTTSTLSSLSSGSPLSVVPSHHPLAIRRERSRSLTGISPGNQSPAYELHHPTMQDFSGVPRMGGMGGGASFVPSHHHIHGQGHGMQAVGVGGGANAVMMMMM